MDHHNGIVEDDLLFGALIIDEHHLNHMSFTDKLDDIVKHIDGTTDLSVPNTLNKDFSVSTSSIDNMVYVAPNDVLNSNITNYCRNPIDTNYQSSVVQSANYMELTAVDTTTTQHLPSIITSNNTGSLPQFSKSFGNRVFPQNSVINESTAFNPIVLSNSNSIPITAITRRSSIFSDDGAYGSFNSNETQRDYKARPRKGRPSNCLRCTRPKNRAFELLEITEKENHLLNKMLCKLENEKRVYVSILKQRGVFK